MRASLTGHNPPSLGLHAGTDIGLVAQAFDTYEIPHPPPSHMSAKDLRGPIH